MTFLVSIRDNNEIFSSMGDGLAPFVSTHDIAQAAFDSLTVEKLGKQEILVLGPELLTYDDVSLSPRANGEDCLLMTSQGCKVVVFGAWKGDNAQENFCRADDRHLHKVWLARGLRALPCAAGAGNRGRY